MKTLLAALVLVLFPPLARSENALILRQKDAPATITRHEVSYLPPNAGLAAGITHNTTCKNNAGKEILALEVGFADFDVFNRFLRVSHQLRLAPLPADRESGWERSVHRSFGLHAFEKYGTGIAYVKAIRFADGDVWRADPAEVLTEMQQFDREVTKDNLLETDQ